MNHRKYEHQHNPIIFTFHTELCMLSYRLLIVLLTTWILVKGYPGTKSIKRLIFFVHFFLTHAATVFHWIQSQSRRHFDILSLDLFSILCPSIFFSICSRNIFIFSIDLPLGCPTANFSWACKSISHLSIRCAGESRGLEFSPHPIFLHIHSHQSVREAHGCLMKNTNDIFFGSNSWH